MASNQEEAARRDAANLERLRRERDAASRQPASRSNNAAFAAADKAYNDALKKR